MSLANCFSTASSAGSGFLTAWDLILKYYQIKNGEKYNSTAARKLSQSFGLEIVGSTTITNKQVCPDLILHFVHVNLIGKFFIPAFAEHN